MNQNEAPDPRERYIGSLLGMALGDAVLNHDAASGSGRGGPEGGVPTAGIQYSADTELAFCLAETLVTSNGFVDPELAGARFLGVLRTPEGETLSETTQTALRSADDSGDFQSGIGGVREAGPLVRAIPVALAHALSESNPDLVVREVMRSVLITHADPDVVNGAIAVAHALRLVMRREIPVELVISDVLSFIDEDEVARQLRITRRVLDGEQANTGDAETIERLLDASEVAGVVAASLYLFGRHDSDFGAALDLANESGGVSPISGAIAGALIGANIGGSAIPANLVESLEGRMYVLMAAPALLRTAQMRAGLFFHLYQP